MECPQCEKEIKGDWIVCPYCTYNPKGHFFATKITMQLAKMEEWQEIINLTQQCPITIYIDKGHVYINYSYD